VYFSVNDGAHWRPLVNGLPAVRAWAIALQPRENDLVISTWGRGIYILDDITPLETLAKAERSERPTLFPVRATTEFVPPSESFVWNVGHSFLAANPPYGALIHYYLPRASGSTDGTLTITDRAEERCVSFSAPSGEGLHRVVWNLRTRSVRDSESGVSSVIRPPMIAAGTFEARLTIAGRVVGKVPIVVRRDPLGPRNQATLDSAFADRMSVDRARDQLAAMYAGVSSLSAQLDSIAPQEDSALLSQAARLAADSIRRDLAAISSAVMSGMRLRMLAAILDSSTTTLSATERGLLKEADTRLANLSVRLDSARTMGIPALRRKTQRTK